MERAFTSPLRTDGVGIVTFLTPALVLSQVTPPPKLVIRDIFAGRVSDLRGEHGDLLRGRVWWLARVLIGDVIPCKTVQRWADCLDAVAEALSANADVEVSDVERPAAMIGSVVECHRTYGAAHPELAQERNQGAAMTNDAPASDSSAPARALAEGQSSASPALKPAEPVSALDARADGAGRPAINRDIARPVMRSQIVYPDACRASVRRYHLTPLDLLAAWDREFQFDCDPVPHPPAPPDRDALEIPWGNSNFVNCPWQSIGEWYGRGTTAFVQKAIAEYRLGKRVVMLLPINYGYINMLLEAGAEARSAGRIKFLDCETRQPSPVARPCALFILDPARRPPE